MSTKLYFQYPTSAESPTLEMHWILEGGRLRSVWTARQPEPFDAGRRDCALNRKDGVRRTAPRAA